MTDSEVLLNPDPALAFCSFPHEDVYKMRMSRVNAYLPDDLAARAKEAGLNVLRLTQDAIRASLAALDLQAWQRRVAALTRTQVDHSAVMDAVRWAKDELEGG